MQWAAFGDNRWGFSIVFFGNFYICKCYIERLLWPQCGVTMQFMVAIDSIIGDINNLPIFSLKTLYILLAVGQEK